MEDSYFDFLMNIVGGYDGTHERGINVCRTLFDIPFWWDSSIPLDSDRCENGIELRLAYFKEKHKYTGIEGEPCRLLEMLVALSMGMDSIVSWSADPHPERWFWEMLENAGISDVDDPGYVVEVADRILSRDYDYYGHGGLFPLNRASTDQRRAPIWSQAGAYMCEHV